MTEIIRPQRMRGLADCGLACLATLLGQPYDEVLAVAEARRIRAQAGLSGREAQILARAFGVRLRRVAPPPLEDDEVSAILTVQAIGTTPHAVVYWRGAVYDPQDGNFYADVAIFLRAYGRSRNPRVPSALVVCDERASVE